MTAATAAAFTSLLFVRSAWHKLADFESFTGFVMDYQILPTWALPAVSRAIVVAELLVPVSLITIGWRRVGASLAIVMLLGYAAAMSTNILRGRTRLECGCGGAPQLLHWSLIVRNVALTGAAALVFLPAVPALAPGELSTTIAGGFTLWLGFLLVEQLLRNNAYVRMII